MPTWAADVLSEIRGAKFDLGQTSWVAVEINPLKNDIHEWHFNTQVTLIALMVEREGQMEREEFKK